MPRSRKLTAQEQLVLQRSSEVHDLRSRSLQRKIDKIKAEVAPLMKRATRLQGLLQQSLEGYQADVAGVAKRCGVPVAIEQCEPVLKRGKIVRFQWKDKGASPDALPEQVGKDLAKRKKKPKPGKVDRPLDDKPAAPPTAEASPAAAPVAEPKAEEK